MCGSGEVLCAAAGLSASAGPRVASGPACERRNPEMGIGIEILGV